MSKPGTAIALPVLLFAEKNIPAVVSITVSVTSLKIGKFSERFIDFTRGRYCLHLVQGK